PFLFSIGSGGAGVLQNIALGAGDQVKLQVRRESGPYGTYVGVNFSVEFTATPPPPCVDPPSGLVAWWRAEGNTVDSAGSHYGVLGGGGGFGLSRVGQGFSFDGIDDHVNVPHSDD